MFSIVEVNKPGSTSKSYYPTVHWSRTDNA
mgnify:CR=1 FL=1